MAGRRTRNLIRTLVGIALCAALLGCVAVPVPEDLPAIAIRQPALYRLEVAPLIFYGWLLLITPAVSGLVRGRLPIEISTRGARFAEETEQSAKLNEQKIEDLKQVTDELAEGLETAHLEMGQLKRDNSPPAVGSVR